MEERIAVQCKNSKEWNEVKGKLRLKYLDWDVDWADHHKEDTCIMESGFHNGRPGWSILASCTKEGYTIITAAEYLGGKDVKEFEKGDKVEYIGESLHNYLQKGHVYTINKYWGDGSDFYIRTEEFLEYNNTHSRYAKQFKLVGSATKPKTTKENNMNKNISNVFDKTKEALLVEKHLGNQIGTSFIDGLVLADKKEDVLKEAKRLEKESKE